MQRLTWLQLSDWPKRSRSLIGRWYAMLLIRGVRKWAQIVPHL